MRILKILLITFLLCIFIIPSLNCASKSDSKTVPETQEVTVQRGNLTIDITATGNLKLSLTEDLAFEIAGTVEEVLVEEGDTVKKGQVLARLDASEWDDYLATLEDKLTATQRQLTSKKRDLIQAQINLNNADLALEKAEEESTDRLEIEAKELALELAEGRVEDAEKAIEDVEKDIEEAQEELDEAKGKSPEITAPFAGFINKVNVEGGDEILKGTVAVQLADPNKFEADILVSEMDILQVKLGGDAWVQADALPGMSLPAKLTHISPTATIQSGVVNYKLKVEIQPLEAVTGEGQQASQEAVPGEFSERIKQAIEEGRITPEQAEEMMKQRQQGQGGQQGQTPMMRPEDVHLREGMTVMVSILVEERNDVLLVPNKAITIQGGKTHVQVVLPDGITEPRQITAGISDAQYTEVIDGLSEGEKVAVPKGTAATPTTSQQGQRPPGGMFIPGMGGRPR